MQLQICCIGFLLGEILVKRFLSSCSQKKTNGAPNGFYGDIDWDRYVSKNAAFEQ